MKSDLRFRVTLVAALLCIAPLHSASAQRRSATTGADFDEPGEMEDLNRELWEFARKSSYDLAVRHARASQQQQRQQPVYATLPTGWRIAPAGRQIEVGRFPGEAVFFGNTLVVLNAGYYPAGAENPEVTQVDVARGQVTRTVRLASLYPSATVNAAGALFVSGGSSNSIFQLDAQLNVVRTFPIPNYAGPIAALDSTHIAVAYLTAPEANATGPGRIGILNTTSGIIEVEDAAGYFPSALLALNGKLYVSLVGENRVLVYDVHGSKPRLLRSIASGRAPQSLCTDGTQVYVVNSGSDDVAAISAGTDEITGHYTVRFPGSESSSAKFGNAPTSCAVIGERLYVTAAGANAVAVFNKDAQTPSGWIPTGWYPTKVLAADGRIAVLSAKGVRARRPNPEGPSAAPAIRRGGPDYVLTLLRGSVALLPDSLVNAQLGNWTQQVSDGAPLYSASAGLRLPIKYVFYVVRENRTYDQVLGDVGRGDSDSTLTIFGEQVTPVAHQLAREFVTLDHFFVDGEISVLGHSFTTSGYASPFLEWLGNTAYASRYRGYPFGQVPGAYSPAYLWDALEARNVSYRVYGEPYYLFTRLYRVITDRFGAESPLAKRFYARSMALADSTDRGVRFSELGKQFAGRSATRDGAQSLLSDSAFVAQLSHIFVGDTSLAEAIVRDSLLRNGVVDWLTHYLVGYPTWNLAYSDLDRVALWRKDLEAAIQRNDVPRFSYLWLPNDHTAGSNPNFPNAFQLVAQNDAALGQLVETISRSSIWKESLIIVEEDDAQAGADHVDATRSIALLAGPYVKRGVVVSDRYDQLSAIRTIELLLGLDPLHLGDALAVPMFGAFTTHPDLKPFRATEASKHLLPEDVQRLKALKR